MENNLPTDFFVLEIERNDKNYVTDDFLKKTIRKISSVSSLIAMESKRGPARKLIFVGNKSIFILKEIQSNMLFNNVINQFEIETKQNTGENYIEVIREGDFLVMEEKKDKWGISEYTLKPSKEKQPDFKKTIKITE